MLRTITKTFIILIFLGSLTTVNAQESAYPDEQYERESIFGAFNSTNGGIISGVFYRTSRKIGKNSLAHYAINIVNTKHPRESREPTFSGNSFIFGKSNYLFSIRPQYGQEKILFKKAPQQGVRIAGLIAGGPSIGLETPYFIELQGGRREQYDPDNLDHNRNAIFGSASPFRGLFQSQLVLGFNLKAALTFETNSTKNRVFGFEAGFNLESFSRKIEILPKAENKGTFVSAFIAVYFGKRR